MNETIRINTERGHLFSPDIHVGMAAKIDGEIDDARVRRAVLALCERHPLLTATIVFDEENAAYYKLNTARPVRITFLEGADWADWMERENRAPFDLAAGPLLRLLVLRSGGCTTFAALGHHLLGDGLSFLYLMRDLLTALDGGLDGARLLPPIIRGGESLPAAGRLRLLARLMVKKWNRDYRKSGKIFTRADYLSLFEAHGAAKKPGMRLFSLGADETRGVVERCRAHGVTVNEALSAAFVLARKRAGVRSEQLAVSCNVRADLTEDPGESMGNFVSGIAGPVRYDDSLDFWKNARGIGDGLNEKLKNPRRRLAALALGAALDDALMDAVSFAGFGGYENAAAQKICDLICGVPADRGLGISNLGRHEMRFKTFSLAEMWFVPPLFAMNDFIVGALTVNGRMTVCLRYAAAQMSGDAADRLFEAARAVILND